jgi:hypothetical protein
VNHELTYAELSKTIGYFDTQYLSDLRMNA